MNFSLIGAGACALLIAATTHAGEEQRTRIEIAVDDDAAGEKSFVFDSQDAGFDLQSMLVGESRRITDSSGSTADVRRTEGGFEIDIDGKTIELPDLHGHDNMHGGHEIAMLIDDSDTDVNNGVKKVEIVKSGSADGITIISGRTIDAATRERISGVMRNAGQDGEITYLDGSELHGDSHNAGGMREVRIIRKEVDVTN